MVGRAPTGCRVGALVAEWILGDGWRNVVTTSSPTSSLATNILYRSLHLYISPPGQGFKLKKWQNWKRQLINALVRNCLRSPTKNLFQQPRLSEASSPVGFKTTPSVVSLRGEGGELLQINKQISPSGYTSRNIWKLLEKNKVLSNFPFINISNQAHHTTYGT